MRSRSVISPARVSAGYHFATVSCTESAPSSCSSSASAATNSLVTEPMEKRVPAPPRDAYAELVAAGALRPPHDDGDPLADWPDPRALRLPAGTAAALIGEDRGS